MRKITKIRLIKYLIEMKKKALKSEVVILLKTGMISNLQIGIKKLGNEQNNIKILNCLSCSRTIPENY